MRGRWGFWVALTALAVGGVLAYQSAVFTSRSGDATPLYSARRHDPYGTAALLDLLQERGVAATTLERPTPRPGSRGVLVQVLTAFSNLPSGRPAGLPSTQPQVPLPQNDALADWVQQGNTVVQFSRTETALMRRLDIRTKEPARRADATDVQDAEQRDVDPADLPGTVSVADAAGPNGFRLRLRSPMSFLDRPHDPAWTPLARDTTKDHAIVAAEYRVGRGRAVFVGAPTPALNGDLGAAQDLDFLLAAAGNGPVLLDEFSHGIGHGATVIGFLLDAGLLPLIVAGRVRGGALRLEHRVAGRQRGRRPAAVALGGRADPHARVSVRPLAQPRRHVRPRRGRTEPPARAGLGLQAGGRADADQSIAGRPAGPMHGGVRPPGRDAAATGKCGACSAGTICVATGPAAAPSAARRCRRRCSAASTESTPPRRPPPSPTAGPTRCSPTS